MSRSIHSSVRCRGLNRCRPVDRCSVGIGEINSRRLDRDLMSLSDHSRHTTRNPRSEESCSLCAAVRNRRRKYLGILLEQGVTVMTVQPAQNAPPDLARVDHLLQISIRRTEHTERMRHLSSISQPAFRFLMENSQKLGMVGRGSVSDFVQEECSTLRVLQKVRLVQRTIRNRPSAIRIHLTPEELIHNLL